MFYQPARQAFSSSQNMQQPSFGGGFGGGFQMPQQNFGGFGGGYGFQQPQYGGFGGGFGGGYGGGFGFQQPQYGGFGGGFQPQYGGFGGGFQQQGFGFNPMFGGIGGLGFNPMMGPQFSMPMQGFGGFVGGFNPAQQQMQQNLQFAQQRDQALAPTHQAAQQAIRQNPAYAQLQQLQSQFRDSNPNPEQLKQIHDLQSQIESSPEYTNAKSAHENAMQQFQEQRQQPMYGGLGSLGFNPMMGAQFGMPMQQLQAMLQGQQFGSQSHLARPDQPYLARPEVRQADEAYLRTWEAGRAALGNKQ